MWSIVVALLGSLRSALRGRGDLVLENLALRQQLALLHHRSKDAQQARDVAEAVAREAFHNVSFFEGSAQSLMEAVRAR